MRTVVVGAGRAGGSFHRALDDVGWECSLMHHDAIDELNERLAVRGGDTPELVLLCVPDSQVGHIAPMVVPTSGVVVAHCAGSLGLDVLAMHDRAASVHPLVAMPDAETGARRLVGAWFAVAGDPGIHQVVEALHGNLVVVPDDRRGAYHAAATVASNHLVALLDEVERLAAIAGVPAEAYFDLARLSIDNVAALGPSAALTGPVSRQDWATVRRHVDAVGAAEREEYLAGVRAVAKLAGVDLPSDLRRDR